MMHADNCVVQENIHTLPPLPPMEGTGNSKGEGVCMIDLLSRGPLIQHGFESSRSKIFSHLLSRSFT